MSGDPSMKHWDLRQDRPFDQNIRIFSMDQFRAEIQKEDADHIKRKLSEDGYNLSRGYGGKFGVETDRMDKSAMGHDYQVFFMMCHNHNNVEIFGEINHLYFIFSDNF